MSSVAEWIETENTQLDDRYELGRTISSGGLGLVYEARHVHTGAKVAVKVLRYERANDAGSKQRLLREASFLGSIQHPNVVRVLDAGFCATHGAYLVMDLLVGRPLDGWLASRTRFPLEEAMPILSDVLDAIDAVHVRGIVHRDIKPANVVIVGRREKHAVLVDFGIASQSGPAVDPRVRLTRDGVVPGTLEYLAPEVCAGHPATRASDIYAFGVLAFELLTGQVPFTGAAVLRDDAATDPRPRQLLHEYGVPTAIADVLLSCIEIDPRKRLHEASRVDAALDAAMSVGRAPETRREEPAVTVDVTSRRAHTRATYVTPIRVLQIGGGELDGRTEDIAEGGLLLVTQRPLKVGDVVMLRLPLPMSGRTETIPATVRWVKPGTLRNAIGVAFDSMNDRAREEIGRYVELNRASVLREEAR